MKSHDEIHLAVSGSGLNYSKNKTDLFDVTNLLQNDSVILAKLYSEYSIDQVDTNGEEQTIIRSQAKTIQKLFKKYQKYKAMFTEMNSKYKHLKKKLRQLYNYNKGLKKPYKKLETQFNVVHQKFIKKISILYHQKSKKTTIGNKMSPIKNRLFDETDSLFIIRDLKEEMKEEKYKYKKLESFIYDVLT